MAAQRKYYSSDVSDHEWRILKRYVPRTRSDTIVGGTPERYAKREIVNAVFYVAVNGCKWEDIPGDLPPTPTVYHYFSIWTKDGTWQRMHRLLRERRRRQAGKRRTPSAGIIDAQSTKNSHIPSYSGYDAGKKVKGIKRMIATDTLGLVLCALVDSANVQDRDLAKEIAPALAAYRALRKLFADQAFRGELVAWFWEHYRTALEIVERTQSGFVVLPKRWVIERTLSWLLNHRRLSVNYERTKKSAETMIYIAMIHVMVKRLARGGY